MTPAGGGLGAARPWGLSQGSAAPLWRSPFRPFYLVGALYGIVLMAAWAGAHLGAWRVPSAGIALSLWHGHELLFGFAAAIVVGITLTALPSWSGTAEIRGGVLAGLVAVWAAGRVAIWAAALLPPWWRAALDLLFFPAVLVAVFGPASSAAISAAAAPSATSSRSRRAPDTRPMPASRSRARSGASSTRPFRSVFVPTSSVCASITPSASSQRNSPKIIGRGVPAAQPFSRA